MILILILMQIPWNDNEELLTAWRDAKTGYPWIDAIMVQVYHVALSRVKIN